MSTWMLAALAAASVTLTYVFCVRPMLRVQRSSGEGMECCGSQRRNDELAELKAEVERLRGSAASHPERCAPPKQL